jgi:hypothetical protein
MRPKEREGREGVEPDRAFEEFLVADHLSLEGVEHDGGNHIVLAAILTLT